MPTSLTRHHVSTVLLLCPAQAGLCCQSTSAEDKQGQGGPGRGRQSYLMTSFGCCLFQLGGGLQKEHQAEGTGS